MAYSSDFEYAICVIPTAEVGGLSLLFDIRLGVGNNVCRYGSNIWWHFIPSIVPNIVIHVTPSCRVRVMSVYPHMLNTSHLTMAVVGCSFCLDRIG
jgi:hypothetical protein